MKGVIRPYVASSYEIARRHNEGLVEPDYYYNKKSAATILGMEKKQLGILTNGGSIPGFKIRLESGTHYLGQDLIDFYKPRPTHARKKNGDITKD